MTTSLQLTQLASATVKQDLIKDFNTSSCGNRIALMGSSNELTCLELILKPDSTDAFPYALSYIEVPDEHACTEMMSSVNIVGIYDSCNVQQSQEFALDPMYVSHVAIERLKAQAVQLKFSNFLFGCNREPLLAILNNCGGAYIFSKAINSRVWSNEVINLTELYKDFIFPEHAVNSYTKQFVVLKASIQHFWITSLEWDAEVRHILYTANAAGYVVAFYYNTESNSFIEYCRLQTGLGRITFMKSFGSFLLLGNIKGLMQLFKVQHFPENRAVLVQTASLWSKADDMSCSKAVVTFLKNDSAYSVLCCKAAHILAFILNTEGALVTTAKYYAGGIKISGLEILSDSKFIICTVASTLQMISLKYFSKASLVQLEAHSIDTPDLDVVNMQIKGIVSSQNHNILSLILFRNKEYTYASKHSDNTCFVSVCKLNNTDPLTELNHLSIPHMDICIDYAIQIRMDILNALNTSKYHEFCNLSNLQLPQRCDDNFIKQLQIKLLIVESIMQYQRVKYKNVRKLQECELNFLHTALELLHIFSRLKHLEVLKMQQQNLSDFQLLAGSCMRYKYEKLIQEVTTEITDDNPLKITINAFNEWFEQQIAQHLITFKDFQTPEMCFDCYEQIDTTTLMCPQWHKVERCGISYTQLPMFNQNHCPNCCIYVVEDFSLLQQLYAPNDIIKCKYCRFLFASDII